MADNSNIVRIMKVLVTYNGSDISLGVIQGLRSAGLPRNGKVNVVRVSDAMAADNGMEGSTRFSDAVFKQLKDELPDWNISYETATGNWGKAVLDIAAVYKPDLIISGNLPVDVVDGKTLLGPAAYKLISESHCAVRIGRAPDDVNKIRNRILIGYDGSQGSHDAVNAVLSRTWPKAMAVKLLAVVDSSVIGYIGRFTPQIVDGATEAKFAVQWTKSLADGPLRKLQAAGLNADIQVRFGNPKEEIVKEAAAWEADSVFVGQNRLLGSPDAGFCLGSVSAAVAAGAPCSVEIVLPTA